MKIVDNSEVGRHGLSEYAATFNSLDDNHSIEFDNLDDYSDIYRLKNYFRKLWRNKELNAKPGFINQENDQGQKFLWVFPDNRPLSETDPALVCNLCGKKLSNRIGETKRYHFRKEHPEYRFHIVRVGSCDEYKCDICDKSVTGFKGLIEHYREYHPEKIGSS